MTDPTVQFKRAPIVEAVLDIDCDFAPGYSVKAMEAAARDRLKDCYPKMRVQLLQELRFEAQPEEGTLNHSSRQNIESLQFLSDDEKQIVQLRRAGYSFNRLAPYSSLDDYLPEIQRSWQIFSDLTAPTQVRAVKLRYINRIALPVIDGKVSLDDYLKLGPRLPAGANLSLAGFLNQYVAIEAGTGHQAVVVLTAQPLEGAKLPIIFDILAASVEQSADPGDWDWLRGKIDALRSLKNRVFTNSLTEKCLSQFQQD